MQFPFKRLLTGPDSISHWPALEEWKNPEYLRRVMGNQMVTVAETPDGYNKFNNLEADFRNADSIVDGYFVEPHQNTIPFSEMLDWLVSRKAAHRKGPVRYVQSQNGNLSGEFERLRDDVPKLDWATECFGISKRLFVELTFR